MVRKAQPKIMPKIVKPTVTKRQKPVNPRTTMVRPNMPNGAKMADNIRSTIKAKMEEAKKKMPMIKPMAKPMMKPKMAGKMK
jgi:hypothetical protein